MDGFAARIDGRPVIVVCRRDRFCARILFIVARELGHLFLGHLDSNSTLVDEAMERNTRDDEEESANRTRVIAEGTWPSARQLAAEARKLG